MTYSAIKLPSILNSKQKEQETIEEIVDYIDKMIYTIINTWNIGK